MKAKPIEEHHCETAAEFLKMLAVNGPVFGHGNSTESPWAFRGNGGTFPLVPSALRPGARFITFGSNGRWTKLGTSATYAERAESELHTLRVFFQTADRHGLPLPEDSQRLRDRLRNLIDELKKNGEHWPALDILSLMAIAQHHGIPTRLLDWSQDPLTSAYFAAEDASRRFAAEIRKMTGGQQWRLMSITNRKSWPEALAESRLEVWGINLVESVGSQVGDEGAACPHIRVVSAPRAGNDNLHAQRGLFTLPMERGIAPWDSKEPYQVAPLEEMVLNWRPLYGRAPFLIRVTLPLCLGPALLRLLVGHGMTAARLFPGYDGIVKSLRERDLFFAHFRDYHFI